MNKHLLSICLITVLCLLLTGCAGGYPADGAKVEAGDYLQQVLLYDSLGTLTADEIFHRCWRVGEDGRLQAKLETQEDFIDYGSGRDYYLSAKKLKNLFTAPDQMMSVEYLLNDITDGQIYQQGDTDILLLRSAEGSTLLATMGKIDGQNRITALFLLEQGEIPPTSVPIEYTWNPYLVSGIYNNIYGHRFSVDFQAMVTAIINGENTFYCSDSANAARLHAHGADIFPPYAKIVANIFYDNGMAHIIYKTFHDPDRVAYLQDFQRSINYLIGSALKQGDNYATTAIALYHALSYQLTLDTESEPDDKNLTAYRALTEFTGNAKNFAAAYAYLCTQMGIHASTAGGVSNRSASHDWTILYMDWRYYYADPTMETQAGGTGLRYFGLTTQQRYEQHGFLPHMTNIADSNTLWGDNVDVSDGKFAPLQEIVEIEQMWRTDGKLTVRGIDTKGETVTITID